MFASFNLPFFTNTHITPSTYSAAAVCDPRGVQRPAGRIPQRLAGRYYPHHLLHTQVRTQCVMYVCMYVCVVYVQVHLLLELPTNESPLLFLNAHVLCS